MKTGLGLYRKYRFLISYINLLIFTIRKYLIGFDVANIFLQRIDKRSLQLILKMNGATIGKDCDIETGLIFHNCKNYKNLIIGNNCHIGKNCFFDLKDKIIIEDNVVISMQCTFVTHLDMVKSGLSSFYPESSGKIEICENSYIGALTTVLMGVNIAENSVISSNTLINKNTKSFSIFAGIPAKEIGKVKKISNK